MKKIKLTKGQRAFWESPARIRGLFGGRGSGKTAIGALEAIRTAQARPGEAGLIIAPDYPHLIRSTWPEFMKWLPDGAIRYHNRSEKILGMQNGSTIYYGGIDDPESWRGPNCNWLWFDEARKKKGIEAWLILLACVRVGPDPKIWITTTPAGMTHWLHQVFVKEADPELKWHGFASVYENRHNLDPLFIKTLEGSYTGPWKEQELYGRFVELEGTIFDRSWFKVVDMAPEGIRWVRFYDLAVSVRDTACFSVGAKAGLHDGKLYVQDIIRGRWQWPDMRKLIIETAQYDGASVPIGVEKVAFQLAAIQELRREPALVGHYIREVVPDKDKLARAMPWASRAEAGQVYLVNGAWVPTFLNEVCDFPQGSFDDQIDSISGACQMIGAMHSGPILVLI